MQNRHQLNMDLAAFAPNADDTHPLSLLLLKVKGLHLWQKAVTPLGMDHLLQTVSRILTRYAPEDATAAHWDHACFALLLPCCPLWCAEDLGEALRVEAQQAKLPGILADRGIALDLSYGCAAIPPLDADQLGIHAEALLLKAEGGPFHSLLHGDAAARKAYRSLAQAYLIHGDPYLREHGLLTSHLAEQAGRKLGFDRMMLRTLKQAAAFSDIAMEAAAGCAFGKSGCLTYGEFRRMARHPVFAGDICRDLALSEAVTEAVLCHHECLDGSGYPRGLRDGDIPLAASVLGAAGTLVSLTLPGRSGHVRPPDQARRVLLDGADRLWPASVVHAILSL